jgi:predicted amidohydrolase
VKELKLQVSKLAFNTDLLILPEMFTTAYMLIPEEISVDFNKIVYQIQTLSNESGVAILGSTPMKTEAGFVNRAILWQPHLAAHSYDKVQLFSPAGEAKHFKAGEIIMNFDFKGLKIRPLICYDLRFPHLSFDGDRYDVLVYMANWPVARIDQWSSLLVGRAIENQVYTIGVNRVGNDDNGYEYPGKSMVVGFDGTILTQLKDAPILVDCTLDIDSQNEYRKQLPFYEDRK